jgi:hypothetical protein
MVRGTQRAKVTEATTELLLLLSPSAMSMRGHHGDASHMAASSPFCSSLPVGMDDKHMFTSHHIIRV